MACGSEDPPEKIDFDKFKIYLENQQYTKKARSGIMGYARRYHSILFNGKAQILQEMTPDKRRHTMTSLAVLSKYLGIYDQWTTLKKRYALRWKNEKRNSLAVFTAIYEGRSNYKEMISWLRNTVTTLPADYANILIYATLVGLRPDEALHSLSYLRTNLSEYYNKDKGTLEHFRFPNQFIRRTKHAYIAVVTPEILGIGNKCRDVHYSGLRVALKRREITMHMQYCRKIFGTFLKMNHIESEIVDLLQGRVTQSVFMQYYFRPDFEKEMARIRKILSRLHKEILVKS